MTGMSSVSCITVLVALIAGQSFARASLVCGPASWEGQVYGKLASTNKKTGVVSLYDIYQQYSYDSPNNRSYTYQVLHNVMAQAEDLVMQIYEQPNLGFRLVALPKYKHCSKEASQYSLSPPCLPDNAKYLARLIQGGISVDAYQFSFYDGAVDVTATYAPDSNLTPLAVVSTTQAGDDYSLGTYTVANVTLGIRDPTVFVVPSYCAAAIASGPAQLTKPLADYF